MKMNYSSLFIYFLCLLISLNSASPSQYIFLPRAKIHNCNCEGCKCVPGSACIDGVCVQNSIVKLCSSDPVTSVSPSNSPNPSSTSTPSITPTSSVSQSASPTPTSTASTSPTSSSSSTPSITPTASASVSASTSMSPFPLSLPRINEFRPNPPGADPSSSQVELRGNPGQSFNGWIIEIEGDTDEGRPPQVDRAVEVSGTFDSNGLLLLSIPDLENPSFTLALLGSFTGSVGENLDPSNTGKLNTSSFGTILDAIGVPDSSSGANLFGSQLNGVDFAFIGDEPRLIFRDTRTGELYAVEDKSGIDRIFDINDNEIPISQFDKDPQADTGTFGSVNPMRI